MAERYVLVGCGPAAISAAEAIRYRDAAAEIVIVGDEPHGYYSRPGLAYHLAKNVPEERLFPFAPQDFARLNVQLVFERATRVDPAAHRVDLAGGRVLTYDRLLLATGSRAIPSKVPGAELDGVVKLDDLDDARDLIRRSGAAKAAVVVGGGITALEIAEGLQARGVRAHYLMRKGRYWSNVLSESESTMVEQGLTAHGVQIHHYTELAAILGRKGRAVGVETGDGAQIPCDIVAIAVGVRPEIALAKAAGLDCERGVRVDEYLRTSDDDIFAAGDIAEVHDTHTDRRTLEVLWSSAVAKGRVAGLNMVAEPAYTYNTGTPLNVTKLAGFEITIVGAVGGGRDSDLEGLSRGDSEVWTGLRPTATVESHSGDVHIRLALGDRTIAGAVVIGDQDITLPLHEIIGTRTDVSDILLSLQQPEAPVAEIVWDFWPCPGARNA
jgi:NAD(P)H-nitrite reductase large subunit